MNKRRSLFHGTKQMTTKIFKKRITSKTSIEKKDFNSNFFYFSETD